MLLLLAGDATNSRRWQTAYDITRQIDDVLPAGAVVADQSLGIRDKYTDLAWLGGRAALDRMQAPSSAIAMFYRYSSAGRSLQVRRKGDYWAGRAATAAGQFQTANSYFQSAAAYPDLFYGQLALERLGRAVPAPVAAMPQYTTTSVERAAFNNRRLVQALRLLRPAKSLGRGGAVRPGPCEIAQYQRRPQPCSRAGAADRTPGLAGVDRAHGSDQGRQLLRKAGLSLRFGFSFE